MRGTLETQRFEQRATGKSEGGPQVHMEKTPAGLGLNV